MIFPGVGEEWPTVMLPPAVAEPDTPQTELRRPGDGLQGFPQGGRVLRRRCRTHGHPQCCADSARCHEQGWTVRCWEVSTPGLEPRGERFQGHRCGCCSGR